MLDGIMKYLLLAFLAVSATSAFAQTRNPADSLAYTEWQLTEYTAYTKKCFLKQPGKVRNKLALHVTIGSDGMIVGEPEVLSPIDTDDFRADVQIALKKLRGCQPYIVDPFRRVREGFTQVFKFEHEEMHLSMTDAIRATFEKCWKRPRTGPTIWVKLSYKPDGTMASRPGLVNPDKSDAYSQAASELLRQLEKCPPVRFPKDVHVNPNRFIDWSFPSYQNAGVSRSKK
ncbi:hypothetical protein JQ629_03040 [Bradyrhizobium sp. AUGA SZCCT0222]|uniref:hypothetical protein n=1 Tax=Bradyrhizobium sp. AUGA SZCCT0222 TaxID=2807668 RepID=UPI001BA69C9B|nr:hypothetical protein [Bradyrhizobium sp. AUGA SZCCT0222]MBR1266476.1 hypothetical protein [Bradyrhizobium sp. AUGA SZCCT0222]